MKTADALSMKFSVDELLSFFQPEEEKAPMHAGVYDLINLAHQQQICIQSHAINVKK